MISLVDTPVDFHIQQTIGLMILLTGILIVYLALKQRKEELKRKEMDRL